MFLREPKMVGYGQVTMEASIWVGVIRFLGWI
jgi:hypothetical protein